MEEKKLRTFALRLPDDLRKRLSEEAEKFGLTESMIVRKALELQLGTDRFHDYLENFEQMIACAESAILSAKKAEAALPVS